MSLPLKCAWRYRNLWWQTRWQWCKYVLININELHRAAAMRLKEWRQIQEERWKLKSGETSISILSAYSISPLMMLQPEPIFLDNFQFSINFHFFISTLPTDCISHEILVLQLLQFGPAIWILELTHTSIKYVHSRASGINVVLIFLFSCYFHLLGTSTNLLFCNSVFTLNRQKLKVNASSCL